MDDDSSMGMNMTGALGNDDSALSLGKIGAASGMGVDDSELSNNAIGVSSSKKDKSGGGNKKKKPKDKKKSKKMRRTSDSGEDMGHGEPSTLKVMT